jgi:hypothetical protein
MQHEMTTTGADRVEPMGAPTYQLTIERGHETTDGYRTYFAPLARAGLTHSVPADAASADAWRAAVVEDVDAGVAWRNRQDRLGHLTAAVRVSLGESRPTAAGDLVFVTLATWSVDEDGALLVHAGEARTATEGARAAYAAVAALLVAWADAVTGRA